MNQDKAREFFSAYYEGTLERGLRQTLDQRLRADAQLTAEYRAFEMTMEHLGQLKFEDIDVPSYLSDRIATRIEQARAAEKPRNPLMLWMPRFAVGGLAAAALLFAVISWLPNSHGSSQPAGLGPTSGSSTQPAWPSETVSVVAAAHSATIHYQSATPRSVKVLDAAGADLQNFQLSAGQSLSTELNNPNPSATLFEVRVSAAGPDEYIAVPGVKAANTTNENGTVADFVKELADRYAVPVILNVHDLGKTTAWNFNAADAKTAAEKSLDSADYDVTLTASGVLSISAK
jgi:hypothetical protein